MSDAEPVDLGFSAADAEKAWLSFDGCDLTIRFTDWREEPIETVFFETLGFSRQAGTGDEEIRDDSVYQMADSGFLSQSSFASRRAGQ